MESKNPGSAIRKNTFDWLTFMQHPFWFTVNNRIFVVN